jgi:hypothetical protein
MVLKDNQLHSYLYTLIGGSTTEWRISMCAPPLADASLDRRLQNVYKNTRRGEALRTLQGLACLGDGRAYAAHHAVLGELVD